MGNKPGWIIAGLLLAGLAAYLIMVFVFPAPDSPTSDTTRPGVLDVQAPVTPVADVLPEAPVLEQDAGDDYAAAIAFHHRHRKEFESMYERLRSDPNVTLDLTDLELCRSLMEWLAPAMKKTNMTYTFVHTPKELKVSAFADGAEDFRNLSRVLRTLMEHFRRTNQIPQAVEPARALFIMGWQLMNERRRYQLVDAGMEYQDLAIPILLEAYKNAGDGKRLEATETYQRELNLARKVTSDKRRIVWDYNAKPGDVFNIIENDRDRTWRIEGTLSLGILKLRQKGRRGNMRKIEELLTTARTSDDELIRAAGKVSESCTREQISGWQH